MGKKAVASGHADAIAFGRRFLATPDMVKRVELGAPLNQYHRETFYTQDQARTRWVQRSCHVTRIA
jgi:12-oxophytodienoic acid reductase